MISYHHLLSLRAELLDITLPGIESPPALCTAVAGFSMVYSSLFKPQFFISPSTSTPRHSGRFSGLSDFDRSPWAKEASFDERPAGLSFFSPRRFGSSVPSFSQILTVPS